jgi:hypothetical protein
MQPAKSAVGVKAETARLPDSPPPGTGNLTLADFCSQFGLNMKTVVRQLKKNGITASEELTIKKIADNNGIGPVDLYESIKAVQ